MLCLQLNILLGRKSHVLSPSPQSTDFRQSPEISMIAYNMTATTSTTSRSATCVSNKKGSGHPRAAGAPSEDEDRYSVIHTNISYATSLLFQLIRCLSPKPAPYWQEKHSSARSQWPHDHRYPFSSTIRMRIRVATLSWRRSIMYLHRHNQPLSYCGTPAHLQPPTHYGPQFYGSSVLQVTIRLTFETSIMQTTTSMPSKYAVGRSDDIAANCEPLTRQRF
jgi:hypothetical protein